MRTLFLALVVIFLSSNTDVQAQSVGINTDGTSPDNSAILDVQSTTKGVLIPRMTMTERTNIASPAQGLIVFDTNSGSFWFYQNAVWQEIKSDNNAIFQKNANVISPNSTQGNEDLVFGNTLLPPVGNTSDTLLFFQHDKIAFRGGQITNKNSWQPTNIGQTSFAYGRNVIASGQYSTAFGVGSTATGTSSFAAGEDAEATGENAVALGALIGAEGDQSIAMGYESYATEDNSIAIGAESEATALGAIALGSNNTATGSRSLASGFQSTASGTESISLGRNNKAQGDRSTVLGMYNDPIVTTGTPLTAASPILTVGNGDSNSNRSNAMVILKDGKVGIGTDSPSEKLEVDGAIVIGNHSATNPVDGTIRYNGTDYEGYDNGNWSQFTNTDEQTLSYENDVLTISNGNSVTISSSSTSADEIKDADENTKIQVEETNNDDIIRFDLAGVEKLKLLNSTNGKARFEFMNNDNNVLMGLDAGDALSSSSAVGNSNTFLGSEAGSATTNGSSNVFIGAQSGKSNTFGSFNTYIGYLSAQFKQTGGSNIFLGFGSGSGNISGSGNVFIGNNVSIPSAASNRLAIHNEASTEETEALIYGEFDNGLLRINGELDINNAYRFPTNNGQPGQALITDANGDLSWTDVSGTGSSGGGLPPKSTVYTTPASEIANGPNGNFGSSVAVNGSYTCIGARTESIIADNVGLGSAYLYKEDAYGWYQEDLFTPINDDTRSFGISVDMDSDNIVVGSDVSESIPFLGRVFYHSYNSSGVTQLSIAQSSDITNLDRFGSVVALSGDYVAVGAFAKNGNLGKAYVFRYDGTNLVEEKILEESGAAFYGASLDIDGDYLVVGAPQTGPFSAGKAFIYQRSGTNWIKQHTINSFGDQTGHAVAIDGNKVAISSTPSNGPQSVQIWKRTGTFWTLEETITAIDSRDRDHFGSSLSIDGNRLVVGASGVESNGANAGAVYAYLFDGTNWIFQKKHIAPNAQANDFIGLSVKIDGTTFIAGGGSNTKVFIDEF